MLITPISSPSDHPTDSYHWRELLEYADLGEVWDLLIVQRNGKYCGHNASEEGYGNYVAQGGLIRVYAIAVFTAS